VTSNAVRRAMEEIRSQKFKDGEFEICSVGTKGQDNIVGQGKEKSLGVVAAELGVKPPTFAEVAYLADTLLSHQPKSITVVYNHFINLLSNNLVSTRLLALPQLKSATKWQETEFDDEDVFQSLSEFQFAATLWAAILENATVEQAVRMTAMEGASTNAGELVKDLTLKYNKTRQTVITTELSEIVGGMSAIMEG
jgi:ATP synthase F1 gamma subunit